MTPWAGVRSTSKALECGLRVAAHFIHTLRGEEG